MRTRLGNYVNDSLISKTILVSDIEFYNVVIGELGTGEYELSCGLHRNGSSRAAELPRLYKSIAAAKAYSTRLFGESTWSPQVDA